MAFIVKKKIHGNEYYYLNENQRIKTKDGSKVKTKTLAYLGKDKKVAEGKAKDIIKNLDKEEKKEFSKEIMDAEEDKIKKNKEESKEEHRDLSIEEMATFCKRKGFVYPSGEVYGGLSGFWDFGPLGSELKKNIKKEWWKFHVWQREDIVGIDEKQKNY